MKENFIKLIAVCLFVWGMCSSYMLPGVCAESRSEDMGKNLPDSAEIVNKLGGMQPREQLRYLAELKRVAPNQARIPFYMGNAMYALGKMDSAKAFFDEAIAADSSFSRAYVNLGLTLDAQRKFFAAEKAFEEAIRWDPKDVLAYCHLGFLNYSRKSYDTAVAYYRKALGIDPNSGQAHYYLGLAFADAHIFKEALREWELVAKSNPESELGKTAEENVKLIKEYMRIKTP
jgi:tetratricopeptide (TPR) repeat protein